MGEVSRVIRNEELNTIRLFSIFGGGTYSPTSFKMLERVAKHLDGKVAPFPQLFRTSHTHDANRPGDGVYSESIHATYTLHAHLQSPLDNCVAQALSDTHIHICAASDSFPRN
jgi:hypothetical protein